MSYMKKIANLFTYIIFITITTIVSSCDSESDGTEDTENWELVWQDEFESTFLDTSKWNYEVGNGYWSNDGWGNNELQYYTGYNKNLSVSNGVLKITAIREEYKGFGYTSARINTQNKFYQQYGKFEARIKLPSGQGYWPAFWLLPQNSPYGDWPTSGEIDILESKGSDPYWISGSLHYGSQADPRYVTYTKDNISTPVTDYHVYSIVWNEDSFYWYIDDELFAWEIFWFAKTASGTYYNFPAPFDTPFYIILNLAIGGNFDGPPDTTTLFPQTMEVDYVRVYTKITGE